MGILRVYLALCVIGDHAGAVLPWQMHDGRQAVQIFYTISGFYMAMVLSTRYANSRDFYLSRFMRIFPPYWLVLAATLVLSAASGLFFDRWLLLRTYINHPFQHNGTTGVLLAAASNLTLIGQDWVMFLQHDFGRALQFTGNFWNDPSPLWRFLLIPQAWSILLCPLRQPIVMRVVNQPIFNTEEKIDRVVGRRVAAPDSLSAGMRLQETGAQLHQSFKHRWMPKGVYRFKTHEEADEWMIKMLARSGLPKT